jgi:hypothetical protein
MIRSFIYALIYTLRYLPGSVGRSKASLLICCGLLCISMLIVSCDSQQQAPPDPQLKLFHVLSSRIIILDTQAEVDGTVQNTGTARYPYDVSLVATFYDNSGNVIGHAQGTAEDVSPGMTGPFVLLGQVDSTKYSRMMVAVVSLRERRLEKNLPSPPPVVP